MGLGQIFRVHVRQADLAACPDHCSLIAMHAVPGVVGRGLMPLRAEVGCQLPGGWTPGKPAGSCMQVHCADTLFPHIVCWTDK